MVTVVASRYETFSMTVAEAQSFGCPLVASDAGAIPELVAHGENGLLFRSGDPKALAREILRLFQDPSLASALGSRGADSVSARLDPASVARRTVEFYDRVIARSGGMAPRPARG